MKFHRSVARALSFILCLALAGCANTRISSANRAATRTAQMIDPPGGAKAGYYGDATSQGAMAAAGAFGLVGGLLAAGVIATNIKSGLKRWEPVIGGRQSAVSRSVREQVGRELTRAAGIRFTESGASDAKLVFQGINYGVHHAGKQEFVAAIVVQVQMQRPPGTAVWKRIAEGRSTTKRTLAGFQSDPRAFDAAIDEAAGKVARELAEHY